MPANVKDLHPVFVERLDLLREGYARIFPPEVLLITSGARTEAEQVALYAQGRQPITTTNMLRRAAGLPPIDEIENAKVVTKRDGIRIRSNHQLVFSRKLGRAFGRAADLLPAWDPDGDGPIKVHVDWNDEGRFRRLGPLCDSVGLVWGGSWKSFPDMPHVELPPDVE